MNGEKDFGTHKTILIAIIYNMKLMSIYGRPSISCEATIFQSYFSEWKNTPKRQSSLLL